MRRGQKQRPATFLVTAVLFGLFCTFGLSSCKKERSPQGLLLTEIQVGEHQVRAELAVTPAEKARGLMYRRKMKRNEGMLFIYEQPQILSFWMKNTFIPLSIAFIDDDGTIVQITDMKPQDTTSHRSNQAIRYALEMNLGWFRDAGVQVGDSAIFDVPKL